MTSRSTLISGALFGMTAVLFGAFGAHGLKEMLVATHRLETFNLAVEYQFYHSLALLLVGLLMLHKNSAKIKYSAIGFSGGIVIFSGSLYLMAVLDTSTLGLITPVGGLLFIAGWLLLLLGVAQKERPH